MGVWPLSKQQIIMHAALGKMVVCLWPERNDGDSDGDDNDDDSTIKLFLDSMRDRAIDDVCETASRLACRLREVGVMASDYTHRPIAPSPPSPRRSFADLFCKLPPLFLGTDDNTDWSPGFTFRRRTRPERQTRKQPLTRTEWRDIRSVDLECTAPRCSGNKDRRQHRRKHPRPFNIQQRTPQKQSEWIIPHMRAF